LNTARFSTVSIFRRLVADARGATAILTALGMTVLVGAVGLATDVAYWQVTQHKMQGAADQAAYAAAHVVDEGGSATVATTTAKGVAAQLGFADGQNSVTVTVNNPPAQSTCCNGVATDWEVIIQQPQPMWLSSVFLSTAPTAAGRSVANQSGTTGGVACVIALDPSAAGALNLAQNATLPSSSCGAAVNSSSTTSLTLADNASIAGPVNDVGQYTLSNGAQLSNASVVTNGPAVTDPYAGLTYPVSFGSCTGQTATSANNSTLNLSPGHFCSGWKAGNSATINLAAGTYYVDCTSGCSGSGVLDIGNSATINGTGGVTIVISDNSAVNIGNGATFNITAPNASSGQPYPGMAIMSLSTSTTVTQNFNNNTAMNITGAMYFRNEALNFSNNGVTPTACTPLIARTIGLSNNVNLDASCTGVGTTTAYMNENPKLVE